MKYSKRIEKLRRPPGKPFSIAIGGNIDKKETRCEQCNMILEGSFSGTYSKELEKMIYFCDSKCEDKYFNKPEDLYLSCQVEGGTTGVM